MSLLSLGTAAFKLGSAIGGAFKKKKKSPTPRSNLLSQAQGAREAAEKYGFNPLTMLQYGQTGASTIGGGGTAPLASIGLISDALQGFDDIFSGDEARRRQADQLNIDLAKVKLDQLRSGVMPSAPQAVDTVGGGLSPLGRARATYANNTGTRIAAVGLGNDPLAPGREIERMPLPNAPGVFQLDNAVTDRMGGPVYIPGDSEPWGIDELATAVVVGVPQMIGRKAADVLEDLRPGWRPFKPADMTEAEFAEYEKKGAAERKRRAERPKKPVPKLTPSEWEKRFGTNRGRMIGPFDASRKPLFK